MRRLPLKSSRCLTGSPHPSPDESATATGAAPASKLGLTGESERVTDLTDQRGCGDRPHTGFVTQDGAVFVEEFIDETFEAADFSSSCPLLGNGCLEPLKAIGTSQGGVDVRIDLFDPTEPVFNKSMASM